MAAMLTGRPILAPPDEAEGLPVAVDRAALVVDEARVETGRLHGLEVEVGLDLGAPLRPGDPQAVGRVERVA
jgi:hypothetical protein